MKLLPIPSLSQLTIGEEKEESKSEDAKDSSQDTIFSIIKDFFVSFKKEELPTKPMGKSAYYSMIQLDSTPPMHHLFVSPRESGIIYPKKSQRDLEGPKKTD